MKESTEDIILIEKYLEGNLDAADRQAFEERLNKDDNLNKLLDEYAVLIAGVKFSGRDHMLAKFQQIEEELAEDTKVVEMVPNKRKIWYYAAASIILLCVAFFLLKPDNTLTSPELALAYFEPYPATVGSASRSTEASKELMASAMEQYEGGDYAQAAELLRNMSEGSEEVNEFYLANAYQANGEFDKATTIYQSLIEDGKLFQEQSSWNLVLCYLSLDQRSKAIDLLENTSFTIESYAIRAEELHKKLQ